MSIFSELKTKAPVVAQWLEKTHATSRNLLFDSEHTAALQEAFDPKWEAGPEVSYTILLDADGNVLYQTDKPVDQLKLRRTILANLPSAYIGLNNYWLEK